MRTFTLPGAPASVSDPPKAEGEIEPEADPSAPLKDLEVEPDSNLVQK